MTDITTKPLFRGTQAIWYILTVIEVLLLLRFVLKLLAANPNAGFTQFIYLFSGIFTAPFQAVFRNMTVEGSVFEWTTLLAMIVYYVLALILVKLLAMGRPVSTREADANLSAQDTTGRNVM